MADAFRHAYVSGVLTQVYKSKTLADLLGQCNEIQNPNPENQHNMDLWNNNVGRDYGSKIKGRKELADAIKDAFKNGELIECPEDKRKYTGTRALLDTYKSVIVLKEGATDLNELFYDFIKERMMSRDEFIEAIENGNYQGYQVVEDNGTRYVRSKPDGVRSNNLG